MDRRAFLGGSGAAAGLGGVALATTGCAGIAEGLVPLDARGEPDIDKTLATLDGVMLALSSLPIPSVSSIVADGRGAERQAAAVHVRRVLRSLMLVGTLRELPLEYQLHPGVQERTRLMMPELDLAMFGSKELLQGLDQAGKRDVTAALRRDPDLVMRAFGELEREAAMGGVPLAHRLAMRRAVHQVSFRLRQSPELFFDEVTSKTERIEQRYDELASEGREVAARATEEALWRQREAYASATKRWGDKVVAKAPAWYASPAFAQVAPGQAQPPPGQAQPPAPPAGQVQPPPGQVQPPPGYGAQPYYPPPPYPYPPYQRPPLPSPEQQELQAWQAGQASKAPPSKPDEPGALEKRRQTGRTLLVVGGVLLGLGAAVAIAGVVILETNFAGAFAITLGALLGIAGLVLLIVGGVKSR